MVCPHCFETNDDGAAFCKECGAPIKGTEGSDQEVYQDLARANLFRMRGDSKAATDVCLGILKRYPHNPTAHSLLGDISADSGDLAQAATWYEMALDLVPDSSIDRQKLDSVRERIRLRDSAETARQIGIPDRGPKFGPYVALVAVTIIAVAIGSFFVGKGLRPAASDDTIRGQVTVGGAQSDSPPPAKAEEPGTKPGPSVQAEPDRPAAPGFGPEAAWLATLQEKGTEKLTYVGLVNDPRGQSATVTVRTVTGESLPITAMRAGLEFYRTLPAFSKVTVRLVQENNVVFVADLLHDAAKTAEAAISAGDTVESQAQVMLSNPWSPPGADSRKEGSGGG